MRADAAEDSEHALHEERRRDEAAVDFKPKTITEAPQKIVSKAGMDAFISKPFHARQLIETLVRHLARRG